MIDTVIIEVPNPRHPFGLRGVGEVPIVPPLAALSNAIYHAVGVRLTKLPMNPGFPSWRPWRPRKEGNRLRITNSGSDLVRSDIPVFGWVPLTGTIRKIR